MKRGTPDHPKVSVLMQILACERATAVGLLELLWHFTARYAPRGDLGRWSDDRIAAGLGWTGDPGAIVSALTHSGWLDVHPSLRLVVHDWHDHADDTTRKHLKRHRLTFVSKVRRLSGQVQTFPDNAHQRRPAVAVPLPLPLPLPGLAEPGLAEPDPPPTGGVGGRALEASPHTEDGRPPAGDACPPSHGHGTDPNSHGPRRAVLDHDPTRRLEVQVVTRCFDLASKVAALDLRAMTDDDVRNVRDAITGTTRGKSITVIRGAPTAWLETSLGAADKFEADLTGGDEPPEKESE